jgi:hypothetical protein
MYELIEAFKSIDRALVRSIDPQIQPIVLLEDIESGSIRTWLKHLLESTDDNAIKNLDWKPLVGQYLVKAKYRVIDFISKKTHISNLAEVRRLEAELLDLARQTDVKWIPAYTPPETRSILAGIQAVAGSLSHLIPEDRARYITFDDRVEFNLTFAIAPETIEELLTSQSLSTEGEMILKVKKPDYLGESMWGFRHGSRGIEVKILHKEWLEDFHKRNVDIRLGDSLRVIMKTTNRYDDTGELTGTTYEITKVLNVEPMSDISLQASLPLRT